EAAIAHPLGTGDRRPRIDSALDVVRGDRGIQVDLVGTGNDVLGVAGEGAFIAAQCRLILRHGIVTHRELARAEPAMCSTEIIVRPWIVGLELQGFADLVDRTVPPWLALAAGRKLVSA